MALWTGITASCGYLKDHIQSHKVSIRIKFVSGWDFPRNSNCSHDSFFDGTITGDSYLEMLTSHVIRQLYSSGKLNDITFQQDGAPPHFARNDWLFKRCFWWASCNRSWFPRSPDFSPLNFNLWGTLKNRASVSTWTAKLNGWVKETNFPWNFFVGSIGAGKCCPGCP